MPWSPAISPRLGGGEAKPEPHALESRYFTETRLLQRDVDVVVGGIDKYGTFYGTILHPKGNISVELLRQGLARVVDYSIDYTNRDNALQYRLAERQAKAAQLRIWKGYVPQQITGTKEFGATVIEVVSGDTVVVKVDGSGDPIGEERKLSLSSLRAPRPGNPKTGKGDEPWATEAKEALRQRLIGRSVTVVVDYERELPLGDRKEKRAFASLYIGKGNKKKSVGEIVVAEGFASVVRHRSDEDRAENYDDLIVAETAAKASKKGVHGGESPPPPRVTDLSFDAKKSRSYLPSLQREADLRAVVEFVFSGSRFKLYIPSENCSIVMALTSIRTPNPSRVGFNDNSSSNNNNNSSNPPTSSNKGGRTGDPFGDEAKNVTRQHLLQRTVEVSLNDMDKNGVALGNLNVLGASGERTPYGLDLVRHGLGHIDDRGISALSPSFVHELQQAQSQAKASKTGIWSIETEEKPEEEVTALTDELIDVRVSEIVDGVRFFVHTTKDDGLAKIAEKMKALTEAEGTTSRQSFAPRRGNVIAAIFDDGTGPLWYRARVEEKLASGGYKVLFIDYGNRATVAADKIRTLEAAYTAIPAQAKEAVLAFLRAPGLDDDFGEAAAVAFSRLAWGKPLRARVHAKEGNALMMSLYDEESKQSLNQALAEEGLARVSKKAERLVSRLAPGAANLVADLKEAQETARRGRLGMWRFGDIDDSDDEYGF